MGQPGGRQARRGLIVEDALEQRRQFARPRERDRSFSGDRGLIRSN